MIDFSQLETYRENNRIEAKKALGGLPHSIWETYSAFANTMGGILLLGVEEQPDKSFSAVGLPAPEFLVEDFWAQIKDPHKVSINLLTPDDVTVEAVDGKRLVAIRIPRAKRADQPVYIDGDPLTGTYRRNGEGDYRLSPDEVHAMMRRASAAEQPPGPADLPLRKALVDYLTKAVCATADEMAGHTGLEKEELTQCLDRLLEERILILTDGRYRLAT